MIDLELRVKELEEENKYYRRMFGPVNYPNYKKKLGDTKINKYTYKPADDLLEELGYKDDGDMNFVNEDIKQSVYFDLKEKRHAVCEYGVHDAGYVDKELNKAIQQKLKELGWLE